MPRGEIGRHKGLKFNLSALSESLKVELVKFGEGFTANTEPRQHVLQGVETRQQAPVKWKGIVQTTKTKVVTKVMVV